MRNIYQILSNDRVHIWGGNPYGRPDYKLDKDSLTFSQRKKADKSLRPIVWFQDKSGAETIPAVLICRLDDKSKVDIPKSLYIVYC